jgi:hypothetical protein
VGVECLPYICIMSYTIDTQRSKDIRKMLKKRPLSFHLKGRIYGYDISQDVTVRFINCESYTNNPYITIEVTMNKPVRDIMDIPSYWGKRQMNRITSNLREIIKSDPQVKKYLKVYLSHFGIINYYVKTIKLTHNEAKS